MNRNRNSPWIRLASVVTPRTSEAVDGPPPELAPLQLRASAPVCCKHQLDRASTPAGLHSSAHESDDLDEIMNDEPSRDAKHPITEPREIPIAPRISGVLPSMDGTIHFHDQPQRSSDEVRDVPVTEHHLPAKRNTQ